MRRSGRLIVSLIAAALLSLATAASVSAQQPLPGAACNQGTGTAHPAGGQKSATAHAAIPHGAGQACATGPVPVQE
jgi:hypothetical protein